MKKILIIFVALGLFSCEDRNGSSSGESCVKVKLVNQLCGQATLQILDAQYFSYGQTWENENGVQLDNVFSTLLPCGFDAPSIGDEFRIRFVDTYVDECARCKALLYGPEKFNYIAVEGNCDPPTE